MIADFLDFLRDSPSPYHAVFEAQKRLSAAGYTALQEDSDWSQLRAGNYFVTLGGSNLLAFSLQDTPTSFRIVGAHTDSPNLRLKPKAEYTSEGYLQLGVEVYGGALLNSWLDRDLGLAGRVRVRGSDGSVATQLFKVAKPWLRVPQLAIHLDREVNEKGVQLNRQEHLAPVWGLGQSDGVSLRAQIAKEAGLEAGSVLSTELMLFDIAAPTLGGHANEFVFSARLDNLAMCHAAVCALALAGTAWPGSGTATGSRRAIDRKGMTPVIALFDHEEVGSESAAGASSAFLPRVLERLCPNREQFLRALSASTCISADMAHAVHPNYANRHDPRHKPVLNGGPVIKTNAQQRYATTAATAQMFAELCLAEEIAVQHYSHRTDLPCGSTIGPITSTLLGIPTVDVGSPLLSMHSAREMCGSEDPIRMTQVLTRYLHGA